LSTVFKLIIEDDEGKTTVYPLQGGEVSIGRLDDNTIRLMERNVSRRHAKVFRDDGIVLIEDLDSYNGVRINGERISGRYEVKEGDLVQIGDFHLALQEVVNVADTKPGVAAVGAATDKALPEPKVRAPIANDEYGRRDTVVDQRLSSEDIVPALTVETPGLPDKLKVRRDSAPLPPFPAQRSSSHTPNPPPISLIVGAPTLAPGPLRISTIPRVICVSTRYAGREFALTRAEVVIGRVDSNDIVIDHRSVSRNHAKIVLDQGGHKILDLQSANGILVNGEEYAMTELRSGDLIELGHVRFRYIPASQPFVPSEDEANEMRQAGVEPPRDLTVARPDTLPTSLRPPSNGRGGSGFDDSTAATVTDTPLSELSAPSATITDSPFLESSAVAATVQDSPFSVLGGGLAATMKDHALSGFSGGVLPRPKARIESEAKTAVDGQANQAKHVAAGIVASEIGNDEHATELNPNAFGAETETDAPAAKPRGSPPGFASGQTRPMPALRANSARRDIRSSGGLSKTWIAFGLMLFVPICVWVFLKFSSASSERDLQLATYVEAGQYDEAVQLYEQEQGEFRDARLALELYKRAIEGRIHRASTGAASDSEIAPAKRPVDPKSYASEGARALAEGDLPKAERLLTRCVEVGNVAECHRNLGILYAQLDETAKAILHYRKYIAMNPNARDAVELRSYIRDAENPR
jgi:pSer/pThr/pTyr-binding forkhead associated (FHA) protein